MGGQIYLQNKLGLNAPRTKSFYRIVLPIMVDLSLFTLQTSITTTWLMYWLGRNPDKQETLHQELMQKIPADGVITDDAVQKMPYLRACIKEANRYFQIQGTITLSERRRDFMKNSRIFRDFLPIFLADKRISTKCLRDFWSGIPLR